MTNLFREPRLRAKITLLGTGSALATAMALLCLAAWQSNQYHQVAQGEVESLIDADLDHITQGVYNLVQTENEAVQQQVNDNLRVARHVLAAAGAMTLSSETVTWKAINQFTTNAETEVRLPKVLIGGRWLGQNADPAKPTAVVDEVTRLVGETSTLFQMMNERGDMIRVATTVRTVAGLRAIGTYAPAILPDGSTNQVIAAILRGETYRGRAFVVNAWHITAYEPLLDQAGKLVGMLYVGFAQKNAEARVRQAILQTKVGRTGYVYVLGGRGEERGRYIVSQRGERDGEDIWQDRDSDGQAVIQRIISTATALKPGTLATERYRWQNPGEAAPRWKIARLAYFEPWDWVIGASAYEDELQTYMTLLQHGRSRMTTTMAIVGLAIALLICMAAFLIAGNIARPVQQMTQAAERIIQGGMPQALEVRSRDEIGILAQTFNFMTTRLKETMEGLRKSEEEYRGLFENALEGIFQTSPEGRMLRANPAMVRMLAYDSAAEMVRTLNDIGHQVYARPEDRQAVLTAILEQGSVVGQELELKRKHGQTIWVSMSAQVVRDPEGHVLFFQGFVTDISARRKAEIEKAHLEEQFLQSQKMESIGRLAGCVAHDFNNMLQTILGNAALALDALPPGSHVRESLEEIEKSAQRSAELTQQLLAFARKQPISPKILDLNHTIAGMLKMLQRLIGESIELAWIPGAALWPIRIDPSQVHQILANLIVNGRDAIHGIGKISIQTSNLDLDATYAGTHAECRPGHYVLLAVSDTGGGMEEAVKARIFEPFFTTKELGKGTGLGLATVFGIMKQNGGLIHVYSEPGCGSTFKLYLPRAEVQADATSEPPQKAEARRSFQGTETVLVVEDEEQILALARRILTHHGYKVLSATTPESALELAARHPGTIHLLLTDVVMPGMNGKALKEQLLATRPGMKCLFMSGYTADVIAHNGILEEGIDFLSKPFTIRSLAEKVREILDA